ncbi:aminotransferase class IV [Bartonella sp. DGB1]|uniref:aminotransferase class IV n=1 Tax=Bartonella sp. DGB1 TaxID=3239807 RepID=UPI003523DB2D
MNTDLKLIETFLYIPNYGAVNLLDHLARLDKSAAYFNFPYTKNKIQKFLTNKLESFKSIKKVRITLDKDGRLELTENDFIRQAPYNKWNIAIASKKLDNNNILYNHKTSYREIYKIARNEFDQKTIQEVIIFNKNNHLADGTISNIFIETPQRQLLTPDLSSGALDGILRKKLIKYLQVKPTQITLSDIKTSRNIYIGNSVRGIIKTNIIY